MNDFTKAQVIENAQMVSRGAKPCSVQAVKQLDGIEAMELAKEENIFCHIVETDDPQWVELWMYRDKRTRIIIDQLPDKPYKKVDHFLLGCVFGYSVDAILDFIAAPHQSKSDPLITGQEHIDPNDVVDSGIATSGAVEGEVNADLRKQFADENKIIISDCSLITENHSEEYIEWLEVKLTRPTVSEEDLAQIFYHNVIRDEDGEIEVGESAMVIAARIKELNR